MSGCITHYAFSAKGWRCYVPLVSTQFVGAKVVWIRVVLNGVLPGSKGRLQALLCLQLSHPGLWRCWQDAVATVTATGPRMMGVGSRVGSRVGVGSGFGRWRGCNGCAEHEHHEPVTGDLWLGGDEVGPNLGGARGGHGVLVHLNGRRCAHRHNGDVKAQGLRGRQLNGPHHLRGLTQRQGYAYVHRAARSDVVRHQEHWAKGHLLEEHGGCARVYVVRHSFGSRLV